MKIESSENDILEAVYRAGAEDGLRSYRKEMKQRLEEAIAEEEEEKHLFTIQRGIGFIMILCLFVLGAVLKEWFAVAVIFPIAAALLLSNKLIITQPGKDNE